MSNRCEQLCFVRSGELTWRRQRNVTAATCGRCASTGKLGGVKFCHKVGHADINRRGFRCNKGRGRWGHGMGRSKSRRAGWYRQCTVGTHCGNMRTGTLELPGRLLVLLRETTGNWSRRTNPLTRDYSKAPAEGW